MNSRVFTWLMTAFCIGVVTCQRPIVKELTTVTNFPEIEKIFKKLHLETSTPTTDLQSQMQKTLNHNKDTKTSEQEMKPIISSPRNEQPETTSHQDSPQKGVPEIVPDTVTTADSHQRSQQNEQTPETVSDATGTTDSHPGSSTQNQPGGSELNAATKEEICGHISKSGYFAMSQMYPYSPDEHKMSLLKNNPILYSHIFEFKRKEKEEGGGRHLLPTYIYTNASKNHHIHVQGRAEPYLESMFSCVFLEGAFLSTVHEYYVSDREYNLSPNPTGYIAGRFLAIRDRDDKKLKLMALAEQPATVEVPKNGASLYASLKEKYSSSKRKYPIIRRLSDGQTIRLCSSVMNGISRSFDDKVKFHPSMDKTVKCHEERTIVRVEGDQESDRSLDAHLWAITCKGQDEKVYQLIQPDNEQNGVFITNNENGVQVVRFYASGMAALMEVQDSYYYGLMLLDRLNFHP